MRWVRRWLAIGTLSIVLVLAGCSSSGGQKADTSSAQGIASGAAAPESGAPAPAAAAGGQTASLAVDTAGVTPADVGRQVVSTATVTLRADDIAAAKQQAAAAVEGAGGFVYGEQGQYGDHPSVTVTLKVPPDHFGAVLSSIAELGEVDSQQITTDDVTDQAIDLDSRIATAQVSVDRLRGFLDRATNVTDVASLENELLRRETDLEKLRAQKRALDGRVDLATIVLTVQPPPAPVPVDTASQPPGFLDGLAAGWHAFVGAVTVALVVVGALLPFASVVAVVTVAAWWWRRRSRPATPAV